MKKESTNENFIRLDHSIIMIEELNIAEKVLLALIRDLSKVDGQCYAGNDYIISITKLHKSTITRALKKLQQLDYITVKTDTYKKSNFYKTRKIFLSKKTLSLGLKQNESTQNESTQIESSLKHIDSTLKQNEHYKRNETEIEKKESNKVQNDSSPNIASEEYDTIIIELFTEYLNSNYYLDANLDADDYIRIFDATYEVYKEKRPNTKVTLDDYFIQHVEFCIKKLSENKNPTISNEISNLDEKNNAPTNDVATYTNEELAKYVKFNTTREELFKKVFYHLSPKDKDEKLEIIRLSIPIIEEYKIDNFLSSSVSKLVNEIRPQLAEAT